MPSFYKLNKFTEKQLKLYLYLIAISLLFNATPVVAEGTTGGEAISNTATATYEDPNNQGATINTTSNTVIVSVAEVAGITISANGVTDSTPADPTKPGDTLYYNYTITNTGNDPTNFRIPNSATVDGPGTKTGDLEVSTDGGKTWTPISGSELLTNTITSLAKGIPPGGSVMVRVPIKINDNAQDGETINVKLGDTPNDAQNQPRTGGDGDVYTVDNPDPSGSPDPTTGEVAGPPVNGVREASKTQQAKVTAVIQNRSWATILKTLDYQPGDLSKLDDDLLTYELNLRVSSDPTGKGLTPQPLVGTTIDVNNSNSQYILLSDAIPVGTVLKDALQPPDNWNVVYTTDPVSISAKDAKWSTTKPAGIITRVGFINNPSAIPSVPVDTTIKGFKFQVVPKDITTTTTIANIAQVFGQTSGDSTNTLIYDESGDQNPNNYDPPTQTFDPFDPQTDDGYIDPTDSNENDIPDELEVIGTDSGNNNQGNGPGGEANIVVITTPSSVLAGPKDKPDAVGPNNNNDDFTNKSTSVPANTLPGSTINPDGLTFTNTVQNSGTTPVNISLLPTPPANAADLPKDTLVKITYGDLSAIYKYDGTKFVFQSGQGTVNGNSISDTNPVRIDGVAANTTENFTVEIDLPPGTSLSTDIERGFPVPVTTFVDNNNDGLLGSNEAKNTTINRVYTGFLKLVKLSRVLKGDGPEVEPSQSDFATTPGIGDAADDVPRKPVAGNIVEYQIKYKNISDAQSGVGNVVLNASKVEITEDGTTWDGTKGNNWALDNDNNGTIDTSNVVNSAKDSGVATINLFSGKPSNTPTTDKSGKTVNDDVTKYVDTVTGLVEPQQERTFTFQRKVN